MWRFTSEQRCLYRKRLSDSGTLRRAAGTDVIARTLARDGQGFWHLRHCREPAGGGDHHRHPGGCRQAERMSTRLLMEKRLRMRSIEPECGNCPRTRTGICARPRWARSFKHRRGQSQNRPFIRSPPVIAAAKAEPGNCPTGPFGTVPRRHLEASCSKSWPESIDDECPTGRRRPAITDLIGGRSTVMLRRSPAPRP